jgi:two-component system C4-dicarboxylate transport sensor histidine kinase DctB
VDPAIRETLFAPFESAKPGGLGLGLAIARDIAREFGGDLILEPGVAPGATFVLTLRTA